MTQSAKNVSISEAAILLGKTERQIRYMIQKQTLDAYKDGSRWIISIKNRPKPETNERQMRGLQATVEATLGISDHKKTKWTVRSLDIFEKGRNIYLETQEKFGDKASAVLYSLFLALQAITRGTHAYHRAQKIRNYQRARQYTCDAITQALLHKDVNIHDVADKLEQDLLTHLSGLMRRAERR